MMKVPQNYVAMISFDGENYKATIETWILKYHYTNLLSDLISNLLFNID